MEQTSPTPAGTMGDAVEMVEFRTVIRDRDVVCHWQDGRLTGDRELLERVDRVAAADGWTASPSSVAKVIRAAVAHPVSIRVVVPERDSRRTPRTAST